MKLPNDILLPLTRQFQNKKGEWLSVELTVDCWPIEIKLGIPTEEIAIKRINDVQAWVKLWQMWQGVGQLFWCERRWKTLGVQRLPEKLVLQDPEEVTAWLGETTRWRQAKDRYQILTAKWPVLASCLSRCFDILADYNETDFQRLSTFLTWFSANPNSNLYPRQLPIMGVDSKWLEKHQGILTKLITAMQNSASNNLNFYQCCGLKALPSLIRMRVLDQALRTSIRNVGDITAPLQDIVNLNLPVTHVFIIENLQTGLAIPDLPGAVVFVHLGYNVEVLSHVPWISQAMCIYWGDLDTHGFAILHRARSYLLNLQSIMMDEETLLYHKTLWGNEEKQSAASKLPLLTEAEQMVYDKLKQQHWGQNIRLEQERIAWDFAWKKLQLSIL